MKVKWGVHSCSYFTRGEWEEGKLTLGLKISVWAGNLTWIFTILVLLTSLLCYFFLVFISAV